MRIALGERKIHAAHELADSARNVLPAALTCAADFVDHRIGREQAVVVHVDRGGERFGGAGNFDQVGKTYLALFEHGLDLEFVVFGGDIGCGRAGTLHMRFVRLRFAAALVFAFNVGNAIELAADRLDHPEPHDVLQEAEPPLVAAFVREVLEARGG